MAAYAYLQHNNHNMNYVEKILAIITPHDCLLCGQEGALLCIWCAPDAFVQIPERCYRCQRLSKDAGVCTKCRRQSPCKNVWVGTEYTETAKQLVQVVKFAHKREGAVIIARYLHEQLPYLADAVIVPVPTASTRVRERGFDQAQLIAQELARLRELPCQQLLVRQTAVRQVGAKRQERIRQMDNAFRLSWRSQDVGHAKQILLIDDVLTTGATLESAARTLREAGHKNLYGAVFAQAI